MRLSALFLAGALGLAPVATSAQGLPDACQVEVDPLNFDRYDPFDPHPNHVVGEVRVRCRLGPPVQHVELSAGQAANYNHRALVGGTGSLRYNIYADSSHRTVAGDGTGGTVVLSSRARTRDLRPLQRFVFYGEIAAGQFQPAGEYVDSVRVTVVF